MGLGFIGFGFIGFGFIGLIGFIGFGFVGFIVLLGLLGLGFRVGEFGSGGSRANYGVSGAGVAEEEIILC